MSLRSFSSLITLTLLALALASCFDEEGNLFGMEIEGATMTPNEAARTGTDMPEVAYLKSVTYLTKDRETTDELDHLEVRFPACTEAWCRASTDDCGLSSGFTYKYQNTGGQKEIQFDNFSNAPALVHWAEKDRVFKFTRSGTDIEISCADCPGVSPFGTNYDSKIVHLQAVR